MRDRAPDDAKNAFAEMVGRQEEEIDLTKAALLIARSEYPDLDINRYLSMLRNMAEAIFSGLEAPRNTLAMVQAINRYLYDEEGFTGNEADYYDPRNSFLNDVLDRKNGIPITLSIVYMEMGRLIGCPISGVGFPQHFLVKYEAPGEEIIIDPFNKGLILTREDCENRIRLAFGRRMELREHYLASITKKQILRRVLTNLKAIHLSNSNHAKALTIIGMLLDISPWDMDEIRDRGKVYHHLEEYDEALADLETYLRFNADAHDAEQIERNVELLRQQLSGSS